MLTPEQEVELGRAAEAALQSDSLFTRTLRELESQYQEATRASQAGSVGRDAREALHAKTCALDDIRARLRAMKDDGEMAQRQIAEQEKRKQ